MRDRADRPATWLHAYNGVGPTMRQEHQAARPAFSGSTVNVPGIGPMVREPSAAGADGVGFGRMRQGSSNAISAALDARAAASGFHPQLGPRNFPSPRGVETLINPDASWAGGMRQANIAAANAAANQLVSPGGLPGFNPAADPSAMRPPGGFQPGFEGRMRGPNVEPGIGLGNGFNGGMRQPGGFVNSGNFGAGVYNGGGMFSGGMRNADGPGFGGMRGGFDAGGPAGGFGGFGGMGGGNVGGGIGAAGMGGGAGGAGGNFGGHMR